MKSIIKIKFPRLQLNIEVSCAKYIYKIIFFWMNFISRNMTTDTQKLCLLHFNHIFRKKNDATIFLPLIWLKMREIAAMAKPEATAVANTERPLPDTAEAAAAPATTRLKRKVAKHSTATARHSSKLRASMDMGGFLSVTSALFSRRADNLDRMVTMCESTSRAKDSVVILGFVVAQSLIEEKKKKTTQRGVLSLSEHVLSENVILTCTFTLTSIERTARSP